MPYTQGVRSSSLPMRCLNSPPDRVHAKRVEVEEYDRVRTVQKKCMSS